MKVKKRKQNVYISGAFLWEMVKDLIIKHSNDAKLGEAVRELVRKYESNE